MMRPFERAGVSGPVPVICPTAQQIFSISRIRENGTDALPVRFTLIRKVGDDTHRTEHLRVSRSPFQDLGRKVDERRRCGKLYRMGEFTARIEQALQAGFPTAKYRNCPGTVFCQYLQSGCYGRGIERRAVTACQRAADDKELV